MSATPLAKLLRAKIKANGPIPLSDFMADALGHPTYGYYHNDRDPLGRAGDFITAPEVSQMFGEIVGLWCAVVWHAMAEPDPMILCELGPGRGTLMADLLRAAALDAAFRKAIRIHLVESSPALRKRQRAALAHEQPVWHDDLASVPRGPMLVIANEFFDALPIRQFVRRADAWRERMVGLEGEHSFTMVDGPAVKLAAPPAQEGAILERGDVAVEVAARLGARLARDDGAALIVDYAHARTAPGDTLQAVRGHERADPLDRPGETDITAHVDFEALAEAAAPARAWGPVTQSAFLRTLGIELRAERLKKANPAKAAEIDSGCRRLIDARHMGSLFKALALAHPDLPAPPGFE